MYLNPSILQIICAVPSCVESSHMVPHIPLYNTSTRPLRSPPTRRNEICKAAIEKHIYDLY